MPKLKDTRKRYSSPQNAGYTKKAGVGSTSTRKFISKYNQENKPAKSTNTSSFDDSSENNTRSLLEKEINTTPKPNIIREHLMPSLADLEKMFEDSENSQQLPLTTSVTSEKGEKSHLIQKSNANDMLSSMDETINENNIMLNESSTPNDNTTPELDPVNQNSNSQIKKAFHNKSLSVSILCKTCKTNHNISNIIDCQKPAEMKTIDLTIDENEHVNSTGTSRRHHRMSRDSCDSADSTQTVINEYYNLPLPSTSRDNNTIKKRFGDCLRRYGFDSPNFPANSEESERLVSKAINEVLYDAIRDGTFDKCSLCFKMKILLDIVDHDIKNNPTNPSVNEPYNCHSKREANSGQLLNMTLCGYSRLNLGNCPICMDNLANSVAVSTFCGHIFCMLCIETAFNANGQICPTCREDLIDPGYHFIFP
ncbi:unnamed protein product [Parnassius mnemosyne]|uniref:RING-type domain-containing protein n=1 Tax=Parnassius mnemosyne TaxID=213953 RepID=A0AAV1LZF7_9NEOP